MADDSSHTSAVAEVQKHPRLHHPRLVKSSDVQSKVHGTGAVGKFNNKLALGITKSVGTMWSAYLFTILALISLPSVLSGVFPSIGHAFPSWLISVGLVALVAWIAQTFLQLVLLPVIIVGQNVISAAQDARAEADHETLIALHSMNVQQLQILEQQDKILALLQKG